MFILEKNCVGCLVHELFGWGRVDACALMFMLFQLMQLPLFAVGHPSSAQGLWIGEFTFGRIHLLVDLSLSCIYSTPLVFGHLDFTNLWKPVNRIRIIMGKLGCTRIQTSSSRRSQKKKKDFCNRFLDSEYFARRLNSPYDKILQKQIDPFFTPPDHVFGQILGL